MNVERNHSLEIDSQLVFELFADPKRHATAFHYLAVVAPLEHVRRRVGRQPMAAQRNMMPGVEARANHRRELSFFKILGFESDNLALFYCKRVMVHAGARVV